MAHSDVPHFHNTEGLRAIRIGAREFQCIGALPPFDHPHVFLDLGRDDEIVCPYCSTLFIHDASLPPGAAEPMSAIFTAERA